MIRRGALLLTAPLAAMAALLSPSLLIIPLGVAFVIFALSAPLVAVGLYSFAHVSTPAYIRAPIPGGLYAPPVSITLLLALAGVGVLAFLANRRIPGLGPRGRVAAGLLALFAAVAAASLIDPRTGGEGVNMWAKVFLFPALTIVAVLAVCRRPADMDRLWLFILAGGVTASLYAAYEHAIKRNPLLDAFGGDSGVVYFTGDVLGDVAYRAFSVYGNPLEFATCMAMIVPYALMRFAKARTAGERLVFALGAAICAFGLAVTYSRGPMIALLIAAAMIGALQPRLRPWLIGAAASALVALAAIWPFIQAAVGERLRDVDNMTLRLKLWEIAVAIFGDHPVLGVGIGNFPQYYIEAERLHRIGPFYEFGEDNVEKIRVAENTYLQLAAETGVLGLAAAALAIGAMLRLSILLIRNARSREARDHAGVLLAGMTAYAVSGLFVTAYTFYFATTLLVGFLFAFVLVLDRHDKSLPDSHPI
ncbi:MAG: hypothetical protein COW75_07200 [Rhodobacterales bacterium CG18_big_fil_WC_8_21_14_2_50_71_9]|nr:MAG: hypothetical protein COW75_07200 [Rhodobacterales bacterium CG18_big_fil_WC_8_21_14_2_50_71_9]